jgi:hypothetical protein
VPARGLLLFPPVRQPARSPCSAASLGCASLTSACAACASISAGAPGATSSARAASAATRSVLVLLASWAATSSVETAAVSSSPARATTAWRQQVGDGAGRVSARRGGSAWRRGRAQRDSMRARTARCGGAPRRSAAAAPAATRACVPAPTTAARGRRPSRPRGAPRRRATGAPPPTAAGARPGGSPSWRRRTPGARWACAAGGGRWAVVRQGSRQRRRSGAPPG